MPIKEVGCTESVQVSFTPNTKRPLTAFFLMIGTSSIPTQINYVGTLLNCRKAEKRSIGLKASKQFAALVILVYVMGLLFMFTHVIKGKKHISKNL